MDLGGRTGPVLASANFTVFDFWRKPMPRISAEARAAATYRAGGKPPAPPKALGEEARAIWQAIVKERPVGWFDSGSLVLLRQYCGTTVEARRFIVILAG